MNTHTKHIPCLITIFGATGDLSHRKLFPSLFHLYQQDNLDDHIAIIGVGRRDYFKNDVNEEESYHELLTFSNELDDTFKLEGNRLFYLAMAPQFFGPISDYLKASGLTETKGFKRLVIEKPFGSDFKSAEKLNNQLRQSFKEEEIYRIDHYLGKDMVQNIEVLRFANAMFEPLWNNKYISNIQITSSEILGVEDRGSTY